MIVFLVVLRVILRPGQFKAHTQTITGQAAVSPNCWATSSEDGTVKLWDARTKNLVSQAGLKSPVYSIAIGAGGQILAAGVDSDLQFFDIRNIREVLGCYTESHSERINQLVFHPDLPTQLMSASEDGLVCVFDIVVAGEDDAVASVMNTESAVNKVGFFGPSSAFAYALTQSETLSLWNVGSAERIGNFRDVIQNLEGTAYSVQYLVDCMYEADSQRLTLVCGDHHGSILFMDVSPTDLSFAGDVPGHTGGHKSTVRNVKSTTDGGLISTGDDGYVHRWDRVSAEDAAVAMKAHAESAGQASTAAAGGLSADGSAVGGGGGGGGAVGREPVGRGAFLGGSISQSMVLHGVRRKVRHQKHRRPHS